MDECTHSMESCHTFEWVMSHICMKGISHIWMRHVSHTWMRHCAHMIKSSHTYVWVIAQIWYNHAAHMNESCHTYAWVMSHMWMSHVTHMNESCHTYEWVMSHSYATWPIHVWDTSHVTHMNEYVTWVMSHIRMSHVSHIWMSHRTRITKSYHWIPDVFWHRMAWFTASICCMSVAAALQSLLHVNRCIAASACHLTHVSRMSVAALQQQWHVAQRMTCMFTCVPCDAATDMRQMTCMSIAALHVIHMCAMTHSYVCHDSMSQTRVFRHLKSPHDVRHVSHETMSHETMSHGTMSHGTMSQETMSHVSFDTSSHVIWRVMWRHSCKCHLHLV